MIETDCENHIMYTYDNFRYNFDDFNKNVFTDQTQAELVAKELALDLNKF